MQSERLGNPPPQGCALVRRLAEMRVLPAVPEIIGGRNINKRGRMSISQPSRVQRLTTETKQAFKTTEFWVMVILLVCLFIAGAVTGGNDGAADATAAAGGGDDLNAGRVWLYAVILAGAYFVSRGLAKSGSRDSYWDDPSTGTTDNGIGERVKAAAEVLRDGPAADRHDSAADQPTRTQI